MFIATRIVDLSIVRCGSAKYLVAYEWDGNDLYVQLSRYLMVMTWHSR